MNPSNIGSSSRRAQSTIDRNSLDVNKFSTWYEDLEDYENTLEEIGNATLDQTFQDEIQHVNQWFSYLTDSEKTATLYTLLQNSSQLQTKFFIHLLQEMRQPKLNPLNRVSERASSLLNLNMRQQKPPSLSVHQNITSQNNQTTTNNRQSFALGDTENFSGMFGSMSTDWYGQDDAPTPHPQPRPRIAGQSNLLRPKSAVDSPINSSFSSSWTNKKPVELFNDNRNNVIKRPRSADISSWALPHESSWQPLSNQHDIDFQQWKNPRYDENNRRYSSGLTSNALRPNSLPLTTHELGKEVPINMNLIKDVPTWFKSMRLHKYNNIFGNMHWQDVVKLSDQELESKGVAALGARRKMLKAFESVKEHCQENNIVY